MSETTKNTLTRNALLGAGIAVALREALKPDFGHYQQQILDNCQAMVRAFLDRGYRIVSGGSTVTMQVVRLSRPGKPRTVRQKLIEIVLALRLEAARSKDEILALYAGYAPFGGNVVGLDAAAWRYFGRPPVELSWAEAATLAVLPNNPALIHPGRNRSQLLEKRNRLLDRLLDSVGVP